MFTPSRKTIPRQQFVIMCWAYIVVGVSSIVIGLFVGGVPVFLTRAHGTHIDPGVLGLSLLFVGFGIARIVLAVRSLRRTRRRS